MAIDLTIPGVGESITEVQIAEWLKKEGDEVQKDENVAVIDSQKTTLELPAPESGRLKILRQAGETVPIGEVVARIETNGEPAKTEPGPQTGKGGEARAAKGNPATRRSHGSGDTARKGRGEARQKRTACHPGSGSQKNDPAGASGGRHSRRG